MTSGQQNVVKGGTPTSASARPAKMWLASTASSETKGPGVQVDSASEAQARRILLLVDDPDQGHWLLDELRERAAPVAWSTKGREGLSLVRSGLVDVVVAEMGLPDLPGLDLLRELRSLPAMPKVILTANHRSEFLAARAIEGGASAVLCKPYTIDQLLALVAHLFGN